MGLAEMKGYLKNKKQPALPSTKCRLLLKFSFAASHLIRFQFCWTR